MVGCHTHMIGHNVQHLPHAVRLESLTEGLVIGLSANLGIQGLVVRDIITMGAPRPGLEKGGGIAMGNAQGVQVWHRLWHTWFFYNTTVHFLLLFYASPVAGRSTTAA